MMGFFVESREDNFSLSPSRNIDTQSVLLLQIAIREV